jgi:hypothetical protein
VIGPLTLQQQLKAWRRRGVQCRLDGGRVRVSGVRRLSVAERSALSASSAQVQQLLVQRAQRRKKDEEQQHGMAMPPERPRRVVGHVASPGYPHLARPLYEDECRPVPAHARVLGKIPYGWLIGGE